MKNGEKNLNVQRIGLKLYVLLSKGAVILVIGFVYVYQHTLSLLLGPCCRFYPSCSAYALGAFKRFGIIAGGWFVLKRLAKCHPFHPGGFDPLPIRVKCCGKERFSGEKITER